MKQPKVAVIGSGFGGLALAIRLQAAGYETTIFEKRDQPGGRAYVFRDNGFTFDAGPTVITAPHCLEELFQVANRSMNNYVKLVPVSPFYRLYWEDGFKFDYSNDNAELKRQILAKSPHDWDGYLKFMAYTKEVFREGYIKLAHVPFSNLWSMVKVAPQLAQLSAFRPVYTMVSKFIQDEQLRQAFSFHSLLVGGNPFSSSSIYTLIHYLERSWGVSFPQGGTGALVNGLVKLFEDIGGKVYLNSEVDSILTKNKKVMGLNLKSGSTLPFDVVVSNADVGHTYKTLLRSEKTLAATRKRVLSQRFSMSLFLIYFGTNKKYSHLKHHNVIFGARYKELLADIFSRGVLADDFSLYLHAPCRTDNSLAPEGCDTFYVLSPVPHLGHDAIDWQSTAPIYADKILNYLESRYMPDLRKHIVTKRYFTPLNFRDDLNSHLGSAFSLEPILTQSAYFRTQNRDKKIQGLYFVGAGTHPGAGVPGVINSAKATSSMILNDYSGPTVPAGHFPEWESLA
ncbi:MAG: phytoene dehydrogenase [Proteobacteria bacterium SG_bin7]|nr:MAG: phytoene dehydrogenase [Proteobacteria bacterium SG_bin7]